jgi:hypothetical protein
MKRLTLFFTLVLANLLSAPIAFSEAPAETIFPDIPGYKTFLCDPHTHTVFSDGQVWPSVRIDEALRESIDCIAITDHIEYQPHKNDIPTNHNRANEIAEWFAKDKNLLLIKGAEITRDTPPGHFNALFLNDVKPLETPDLIDAITAADKQGAFIFWNHPGWKPEKKGWFDIHTTLYESKLLHGIEIANGDSYYPDAHKWALEKGLTMLGASDIHGPSLITQTTAENHRTLTLVFAENLTADSFKDAFVQGRTAVWYKDKIIGQTALLDELFKASVKVTSIKDKFWGKTELVITNSSPLNIQLQKTDPPGTEPLLLPANASASITINRPTTGIVELKYTAQNFHTAPEKPLPVKITILLQ